MKFRLPVEESVMQELARNLLQGSLSVVGYHVIVAEAPDQSDSVFIPIAVVDLSDRPDVADFPRAYRSEVGSEPNCVPAIVDWQFILGRDEAIAALHFVLSTPVACQFILLFPLSELSHVLRSIALSGVLVLADRPPLRLPDRTYNLSPIMSFNVPTAELIEVLKEQEQAERTRMAQEWGDEKRREADEFFKRLRYEHSLRGKVKKWLSKTFWKAE